MRNLELLTAERILAITLPEILYSRSTCECKREFRQLARRWHPDLVPSEESAKVFAHVAELYQQARKKLSQGTWNEPVEKVEEQVEGLKKLKLVDGSIKQFDYTVARPFELGTMYISDHCVTFEVQREFADLFRNGRKHIREVKFQNQEMALEISTYLPQIQDSYKTSSSSVLVLRKTPDQLLLADIVKHFDGQLIPEHVGWILNVLYNIACYLQWSGISHNAISTETLFVSPLRHSGMLLGGWWYAVPIDEPLQIVPDRTLPIIPPDIVHNKRADSRVDLELIKTIGRELLADLPGSHSALNKSLPARLIEWLRLPSNGDAASDYREWKFDVLESCFGGPRFLKMRLDSDLLYKEK